MTIDLSALAAVDKILFDIPLSPVQGHRFQPTGFPDLGAATYETKDGTCLLVESAQSMANRLEATCWDDANEELLEELKGLSYVRVQTADNAFLTCSILEAHRINSVYIENANNKEFHKALASEMGVTKSRPIDRKRFLVALLRFDVGSLIHGAFLESIDGRLRVARAISAFIEAEGVRVAASGGVKNDRVQPGKENEERSAKEGYGNVPFHRDEYVADKITLYANVDLAQIRGYGFDKDATRLLVLLALFKLRALLDGKLRLRTACDFKVDGDLVRASLTGFSLPARKDLLTDLQASIKTCKHHFAKNDGVTTVTYAG